MNPNHDQRGQFASTGGGGVQHVLREVNPRAIGASVVSEALAAAVKEHGPVLAEATQDGFTMRLHDWHPGRKGPGAAHINDRNKSISGAGRKTIESPTGEIIPAGKWMDWAEVHFPANYKSLPRPQRAQLEVEEQKRYVYSKQFKFHKAGVAVDAAAAAAKAWLKAPVY